MLSYAFPFKNIALHKLCICKPYGIPESIPSSVNERVGYNSCALHPTIRHTIKRYGHEIINPRKCDNQSLSSKCVCTQIFALTLQTQCKYQTMSFLSLADKRRVALLCRCIVTWKSLQLSQLWPMGLWGFLCWGAPAFLNLPAAFLHSSPVSKSISPVCNFVVLHCGILQLFTEFYMISLEKSSSKRGRDRERDIPLHSLYYHLSLSPSLFLYFSSL